MLEAEGETEILQTANSVGMSILGDFATVSINYEHGGLTAHTQVFLFKENGTWTAYRDLPTQKDHEAVFMTLAQRYCASQYKHFQGASFLDDSYQNKDPVRRIINFDCSELIDNHWRANPLSLIFAYNPRKGWSIAEVRPYKESKPEPRKTASKTVKTKTEKPPAPKAVNFSNDVVDRFFLSIMEGDTATVKGFIDAGMSPNVKRPGLGHSPLYASVLGHHDEMALMFIELGGDVNFKDENQATPLIWAAGNCQSIPLVKALVEAGADVNAKAKGGGTALIIAEAMQCKEIVKILKRAGAR